MARKSKEADLSRKPDFPSARDLPEPSTEAQEDARRKTSRGVLPHGSFGHDPYNSADREHMAWLMLRRALHNGHRVAWMLLP